MADIFISYAREDETRIRELVRALEGQGWSIFWDRRIPAGKTWQSYIGQALSDAKCVIVAWSHHSISSEWVIEEANDAKDRGVLVPVLLDSVKPPLGFRGIQAADLTDWKPGRSSPYFDQLIQDISGVVGGKPHRPMPEEGLTARTQPVAIPRGIPTEPPPHEPAPLQPEPLKARLQEPEAIKLASPQPGKKRNNFLTGVIITLVLAIVVGWALWSSREPRLPEIKPVEPPVAKAPEVPPKAQEVSKPEVKPPEPQPETLKKTKAALEYDDPVGTIKIRPGEPVHIACWMVIAGPDASLGLDTMRAVEIAIDNKGGKLLGHPIKLTAQDTGCNAEGGQAAATKLAADPTVVAAVGSNCSSEARAGAPILWKAGIATVSPSNTSPFLTDPKRGPDYDGYLRTSHNDKVQGAVAAEFAIKQLKVKKAATIHDGSVYAVYLQAVFAETFKKMGGTTTSQEEVAPTDTDMRPVLIKIASGKPEFLYYPIFTAAGGHITRQVKEIKGLETVNLMGADAIFSTDFYKAAGEAAVGMYHSSPVFAFGAGYNAFLDKHQKKYGEKPIAPFHAHGYDAAMMIFAAIQKVAEKAPDGTLYIGRQKLRDALYATKGLKGLTGTISCDRYGDCAEPRIAVYKTSEENVRKLTLPDRPFWRPN